MAFCFIKARLVCLSENVGQTLLCGEMMKPGSSQLLYHKSVFTVGDRSFRWEYPPDSDHISRRPDHKQLAQRQSPMPKVLRQNNSQIKGTAEARRNFVNLGDVFKLASPKLG